MSGSKTKEIPRIMVFRPTMEEFKDFSKYIEYIESQGANRAGLAKIIPPKEWKPRKGGYDDIGDRVIPAPITQEVQGRQGLYQQYNIQRKSMTIKEFRKMAESSKFQTPPHFDYEELDRKYWKNVTYVSPVYGADVSGSLYDRDVEEFNINRLNTCLDLIGEDYKIKIEGVNTAYLYFGMWKTTFAWHTEDMDLYSINYLHYGAPKSWYAIPPEHGKRLERLATGFFPSSSKVCPAFLRHKMTIISPHILKQYSIPFNKITQEPGEFMITFPYGYHSGYNHGYNCAESTNFALPRWIEYGKRCSQCTCRNDSVKISMESFVKKYQPDRYETWLEGKDMGCHPEDPSRIFAAPLPGRLKNIKFDRKMGRIDSGPKRHPAHLKINKNGEKVDLLPEDDIAIEEAAPCPELEPKIETPEEITPDYITAVEEKVTPVKIEAEAVESTAQKTKLIVKRKSSGDSVVSKRKKDDDPDYQPDEDELEYSVVKRLHKSTPELESILPCEAMPTINYEKSTVATPKNNVPVKNEKVFVSKKQEEQAFQLPLPPWMFNQDETSISVTSADSNPNYIIPDLVPPSNQAVDAASSLLALSQQPTVDGDHLCYSKPAQNNLSSPRTVSTGCDNETRARSEDDERRLTWKNIISNISHQKPFDFDIEEEFNRLCASAPPHCAVCMIFTPFSDVVVCRNSISTPPKESKALVPLSYFRTAAKDDDADKMWRLLSCSTCGICVHECCYGESDATMPWKCDRCSSNQLLAECSVCNLRGGPLKPTMSAKWIHVTCALVIPDIQFNYSLGVVDCSNVSTARQYLKCSFCGFKSSKTNACVQCSAGRCLQAFHVTCAYLYGVVFEVSDWPSPIQALCLKHVNKSKKDKVPERDLNPVVEGSTVIAKHKNSRYYYAEVLEVATQTFYTVTFEDGTFSEDLFPEDIVSQDCLNDGPPNIGSDVNVRWTDSAIYSGIFQGCTTCIMCTVEFEDDSTNKVKRSNVYAKGEKLPKKVTSRLSLATEGRHTDLFNKNEQAEGKRIRHINTKYQTECILPTNTFPFLNS